jgi:uncharacterized protein (DUF302 family)
VLSLCKPKYAGEILSDDERKRVLAMMPCRIGVYESDRGDVFITQMNTGLMSKMFGGVVEKVMAEVSAEEHQMLNPLIRQ